MQYISCVPIQCNQRLCSIPYASLRWTGNRTSKKRNAGKRELHRMCGSTSLLFTRWHFVPEIPCWGLFSVSKVQPNRFTDWYLVLVPSVPSMSSTFSSRAFYSPSRGMSIEGVQALCLLPQTTPYIARKAMPKALDKYEHQSTRVDN